MILAQRSFVKCLTGSKGLVIMTDAVVCFHPSILLNNEKISSEISKDKIAVCEKIVGLRSGSFLNSACQKVLVLVKIWQFQDMLNENRFLDTFR